MKIFELKWNKQDEKEWIAAHTNIEAIKTYLSITSTDICDLDDEDEISEVHKDQWGKMTITNDDSELEPQTFEEYMKDCKHPDIIAGTMYE